MFGSLRHALSLALSQFLSRVRPWPWRSDREIKHYKRKYNRISHNIIKAIFFYV
jgi:hypothetical protein